MAPSAALNQRITEALRAVRVHPEHELTPPYRHLLYVALGVRIRVADPVDASDLSGVVRRASLGIMTARHIMERDRSEGATEPAVLSWLERAEEVARLTAERRIIAAERKALDTEVAKPAWHQAEAAYGAERTRAAVVALTAAAALRAALSDQLDLWEDGGVFYPAGGEGAMADADLAIHNLDVAALAARAEAGDDAGKRSAFWEWWLTTAIPAAWEMAPSRTFPAPGDGPPVGIKLVATIGWEERPFAVLQPSPDGALLAYGVAGGPVRLWSLVEGQALAELEGSVAGSRIGVASPDQTVAFAPDGRTLAAPRARGGVGVWTSEGRGLLTLVDPDQRGGNDLLPRAVRFASDGERIAVTAPDGRTIRVWGATGSILATLEVGEGDAAALRAIFSPEGDLLAALDAAGYARLWETETWASLGRFSALPDAGRGPDDGDWHRWLWCDFSPDGSRLIVRGHNARGWAHVWAVERTGLPGRVGLSAVGSVLPLGRWPSTEVGLSPDGELLAIGDGGGQNTPPGSRDPGIHLFATRTLERVGYLRCPDDRPASCVFSPDGSLLAMAGDGGGEVWIWDVRDRRIVASFPAHADAWDVREGAPESPFGRLVWVPSRGQIVTSGMDPDTPNPNHVRPYALGVHYTIKVWAVGHG